MQQSEIDGWLAYNQVEPLWPSLLNSFRLKLGIKSVAEAFFAIAPAEEQDTDLGIAVGAFEAFAALMPADQAADFKKDIEAYRLLV
jgi:hypothetical protein